MLPQTHHEGIALRGNSTMVEVVTRTGHNHYWLVKFPLAIAPPHPNCRIHWLRPRSCWCWRSHLCWSWEYSSGISTHQISLLTSSCGDSSFSFKWEDAAIAARRIWTPLMIMMVYLRWLLARWRCWSVAAAGWYLATDYVIVLSIFVSLRSSSWSSLIWFAHLARRWREAGDHRLAN